MNLGHLKSPGAEKSLVFNREIAKITRKQTKGVSHSVN